MSQIGAPSSAVIANPSKTKKSNSQESKRKKVNDSQETTAIIEEAQVSDHSLSSSTYVPNNEATDFSQIALSTTCTMISMTDPQTYSTQVLQQSSSQSHQYQPQHQPQHHHNTRYSAHRQQQAVYSVTQSSQASCLPANRC